MSGDLYLTMRLVANINRANHVAARLALFPIIKTWAGSQLSKIIPSGSTAKGTAVKGGSDLDLFISIKPSCPDSLHDIFYSLKQALGNAGFSPRVQNVSLGLIAGGVKVDLVPGKVQPGSNNYHSIYKSKQSSWAQTNIQLHITTVLKSGCTSEIRLLKLWRMKHSLEFPSLLIELVTLEALSGSKLTARSARLRRVLSFIVSDIQTRRFVDPSNTANIVSDDLDAQEKRDIAAAAAKSFSDSLTDWSLVL